MTASTAGEAKLPHAVEADEWGSRLPAVWQKRVELASACRTDGRGVFTDAGTSAQSQSSSATTPSGDTLLSQGWPCRFYDNGSAIRHF